MTHFPDFPAVRRLLDVACSAERDLAWVESDPALSPPRLVARDRALSRLDAALRHLVTTGRIDPAGYRRILADSLVALARERRVARGCVLPVDDDDGYWPRRSTRDRALIRAWRLARVRAGFLTAFARLRGRLPQ
jgi:hypothetical protein